MSIIPQIDSQTLLVIYIDEGNVQRWSQYG